jgi:small redox-active disulfide protein 2
MSNLKIQVFGSGCPSCKRLHERTVQAAKELGLDVEVEYVTDIQRLMALGVMSSPVLAVDGKPVLMGFVPDVEDIKKAIAS